MLLLIFYTFSVVEQGYRTEPSTEDIMHGNDALLKCRIPSYVADLTEVVGWVDSEGHEYRVNGNYGNFTSNITQNWTPCFSLKRLNVLVVEQGYRTEPSNEDIVLGNDALMKCKIPSLVADMVTVVGWVNSEATEYRISNNYGNFVGNLAINWTSCCCYQDFLFFSCWARIQDRANKWRYHAWQWCLDEMQSSELCSWLGWSCGLG